MAETSDTLTLIAGGDVAPVKQPVDNLAELVLPTLRKVDFRIAQCERTYSTRGSFPEWMTIPSGRWSRLSPEFASIFKKAEIDVVSMASNHALDWGIEPMLDTIDLFHSWGMQVIGGGRNLEEAHKPAILEKNGVRVATLAYCSVLREGQAATPTLAGLAAIRVRTWYVPVDFQPGCPPLVMSEALEEDVAAMKEDIRKAKQQADAVVILFHWGIRYVPKVIATYQPPVAHAAIDAGADLIIGHHAHIPKAVEVYKGKVCFYSIGNFLTTGPLLYPDPPRAEWNVFWYQPRENSLYRFPTDCQRSILPRITFTKMGVKRVAMLPAYINDAAQPEVLRANDPRFNPMVDYLEWVSDQVPHKFKVDGDEVVVEAD